MRSLHLRAVVRHSSMTSASFLTRQIERIFMSSQSPGAKQLLTPPCIAPAQQIDRHEEAVENQFPLECPNGQTENFAGDVALIVKTAAGKLAMVTLPSAGGIAMLEHG